MPDLFAGIRLKLQRGCDQLDALKKEIATFLDGDPYEPTVKFNRVHGSHEGRFVFDVSMGMRVKTPCPLMWGIVVGEIVHDFRSALDHVVYRLSTSDKARTLFPIFIEATKFDDHAATMLKGVRAERAALIKVLQPFSTGEHVKSPLWHLAELSNFDKHRTLHLTFGHLQSFNFGFPPLACAAQITHQVRQGGTFEDDTEIARAHIVCNEPPFGREDVKVNVKINFEVVFNEGTPAPGVWTVLGTLLDIADRCADVLERIGRESFEIQGLALPRPHDSTRTQFETDLV